MSPAPDVLVIGGGIIGLTSAYYLAKAGLKVELIEKGELGKEASWAGAGIIPPGNPDRAATPIDILRGIGSKQFPHLTTELKNRTGIDPGYRLCGAIEFQVIEKEFLSQFEKEGIPFEVWNHKSRWREGLQVLALWNPAVFFPTYAQVRNPRHLKALISSCHQVGVMFSSGYVAQDWDSHPDRIHCIYLSDGSKKTAAKYLVASGAWSTPLLQRLGCSPDVHPVRGQILLLQTPHDLFTRILIVGKRYLVPRGEGLVLVGSTEEPEAGFNKTTTPEGINELATFAEYLVPALKGAKREAEWAGLRPGSPDGLPFLGPVPGYENVFAAVGHFRAGVQLSIGTAEVVTAWATGKPYPVPIETFGLDRTPDYSFRPAFRS